MNRRSFIGIFTSGASALSSEKGFRALFPFSGSVKTKRESMEAWLDGKTEASYFPAAFFLHFGNEFRTGSAAVSKHLEFFRFTGMDFVKIQYEQTFPARNDILKPSDWQKLDPVKVDFFVPLLSAVKDIIGSVKKEAHIIMTLYSPYMLSSQFVTLPVLKKHLEEDPVAVKRGMDKVTESQMLFVRECIKLGVDGFYMSTQGSESGQFSDGKIFNEFIKPTDLVAMNEAFTKCPFNILHVCDYNASYDDFSSVLDYPAQVVNCNFRLGNKELSWSEISRMFGRPCMGGIDRHGIITSGTLSRIEAEVKNVLRNVPQQFILGADCTIPSDIDWNRLRHAINVAHNFQP